MTQTRFAIVFALLCTIGCAADHKEIAPTTQVTVSTPTLTPPPAVGELGVPFGTVVEIRATIFAGSTLNTKGDDGVYLLRVTEVNGQPLSWTPLMRFTWHRFTSVKLVNNVYDLYELKHGAQP